MSNNEIILVAKNISKTYTIDGQIFHALNNVNFELKKGETLGIIGGNGAGKSTLLKILAETITPNDGEIRYKGKILSILEIGTGFHPDLSGHENIFFNAALLGMSKQEIEKEISSIIAFSGIGRFINEPVKNYSNGMYLRLALAIALHVNYSIILIDEVISVGDAEFREVAMQRIKQQISEGRSCILVSHDLQTIANICSKCIVLENGKASFYDAGREGIDNYIEKINNKIHTHANPVTKHEKCEFISAHTVKSVYQLNEQVELHITYEKKCLDDIDIVLKIKDYQRLLLSDCEIYRPYYIRKHIEPGIYKTICVIPPNLFDKGSYSIDILFGDKESTLLHIDSAINFKTVVSEWEKEKKWNEGNDNIPFRPICEWKTKQINLFTNE